MSTIFLILTATNSIVIYNIQKIYLTRYIVRSNKLFKWLNGTELALHVGGLGFESRPLFVISFNYIILLGPQTKLSHGYVSIS